MLLSKRATEIINPKFEARNSKQYQNLSDRNSKRLPRLSRKAGFRTFGFQVFEFISDFVLRISDFNHMQLKKALEQFGLNNKQAVVYLATLELGAAPVARIAAKTKIPRATCYDILESLCTLGIASKFMKRTVRYFSVEDPQKLVRIAHERAAGLEDIIPELEAIWGNSRERPSVRFYQGEEGIKQVYDEIIHTKSEVLVVSTPHDLLATFPKVHKKFIERRVENKISVRLIIPESQLGRERQEKGVKELRSVRFVPSQFTYHAAIMLFGNQIAYLSFVKDLIAVIIESKELADVQRASFEFMWQNAKP